MGYGIGLSGLKSASEAIDVTSNNISNAQTVGYKSGEYVFSDQFFRAQDPQSVDRAGMGSYRMAIRRTGSYGTVVNSQNPLDMAITGPGMFMLAKTIDGTVPTENPTKFQFTRNGQFAVDNENRIVNQNGMYLVGYPADASGAIISSAKSVMILDRTPLAQQATKNSEIHLNLDNRVDPITGNAFNTTEPTSYSQSTSQTVYDDKGTAHTLSVYYKKMHSAELELTGNGTGTTFTFSPKQELSTTLSGEQTNLIASSSKALAAAGGTTETISNAVLTYVSGGSEKLDTVIGGLGGITAGSGYTNGTYNGVALSGGSGSGATANITVSGNKVTAVTLVNQGVGYAANDLLGVTPNLVGGTGTGFSIPVTTIQTNRIGVLGAIGGSGGANYVNGETVTLTGGAGSSGATATVAVNGSGAVTGVTLTNPGTGYIAGEVLTIVGATGTGATIAVSSLRAGVKALGAVTSGSGYTDGIYEDVPLTGSSTGTGAKATIVVSAGAIVKTTLTDSGSGYLNTDTLSVAANSIGGTGSGFSVPVSSVNTAIAGGEGTRGATYNLRLKDGTNLSVTQISEAGNGTPKYTVNVDRYAVFATLDGNPVGQDAAATGLSTVKIGGILTNEQTSLGTVAFVGGKNIDSLSRDAFGTPQFDTQFKIDASGGTGSGWGQTTNGGVVQFTLKSTDMTAYSSAGQTYGNSQDGSATSQLASYNVDSSGRLTAQYDNGSSVVKGQLILAYFNNLEGLIPNGNNTYEASQSSGEPLLSFPGDGTLGAIRSKAVEQSNVDLTEELVRLMVLQRQYSAVSQATKVMAATLIDDAINIGR
ncbi:flagellar hook-basal body complex protein [Polynucleobacter sp. AM-7D1]|uniref:flagellar hook-basal body complex protein n=1 Tax=Polynucleobacter sp. AM-7D1 TaxID=2689102 RepID=UPI001BFCE2FB|nr:flagellar hook-basal body complex protein [Polynucleobacter sp. AM-7D1]QWE29131.1 flagellar hook-basal body complex protein [Polynucleobacter sp. AM-7D1]